MFLYLKLSFCDGWQEGCKGFVATWRTSYLLFALNLMIFIMIWLESKTLPIDSWSDDMVCFLVPTRVCKRNRVTGHLRENPVNSSMKCTEATLFEITLVWNPQYCKGEKKNIYLQQMRGKKHPQPLLFPLSSSAGILNTFLWDLLRIWKDWSYTWLDRHCATLLNLMRQVRHCIKIEREAVRTRFLWIDGVKSWSKHRGSVSVKHREALLIFRWCCHR